MAGQFAEFELADGTKGEGIRIILKDKLQYERTARVKKWDPEKDFFSFGAFLAWHASKREWLHELTFEDFTDKAIEATVTGENADEVTDDRKDTGLGLDQS